MPDNYLSIQAVVQSHSNSHCLYMIENTLCSSDFNSGSDSDTLSTSMPLTSLFPTVLVTGGAGFIGSHTAHKLLLQGHRVVVIDELNDYYDINIKLENLALLRDVARKVNGDSSLFQFYHGDICDRELLEKIMQDEGVDAIVHLAARAGVRTSIDDPDVYVHSNLLGSTVIFDTARKFNVRHVVYASSSSVYGANKKVPFSESDSTDNIVSPYAATKKACEAMATAYSSMFKYHITGLRFFTVYGPRGRPDMAPFKFVDHIARGKSIDQYGDGSSSRDYTFIDDIVSGIVSALARPFDSAGRIKPNAPLHTVYNLGNSSPVTLLQFIATIEKAVGRKAIIKRKPMQMGDVDRTYADLRKSSLELSYSPKVSLEQGMQHLVEWWRSRYEPTQ